VKKFPILGLAKLIADVVGFKGRIALDSTKPDGTPRKLLDSSRLHKSWIPSSNNFEEGIRATYQDFLKKRVDECDASSVKDCRTPRASEFDHR
jgi:GDP-L-fucose synthase